MPNVLTVNKLTIAVGNLNPNITISNNSATLLTSSIPIALRNNPTFAGSKQSLEGLTDVSIVDKQQNSTVSYNEPSNKYEIKQLTVDGGLF
jgi:hypothetical protein